jgi:hypothetical protein
MPIVKVTGEGLPFVNVTGPAFLVWPFFPLINQLAAENDIGGGENGVNNCPQGVVTPIVLPVARGTVRNAPVLHG